MAKMASYKYKVIDWEMVYVPAGRDIWRRRRRRKRELEHKYHFLCFFFQKLQSFPQFPLARRSLSSLLPPIIPSKRHRLDLDNIPFKFQPPVFSESVRCYPVK